MPLCFEMSPEKGGEKKTKKTLYDSLDRSSNTYLFKRLTGGRFEEDSA